MHVYRECAGISISEREESRNEQRQWAAVQLQQRPQPTPQKVFQTVAMGQAFTLCLRLCAGCHQSLNEDLRQYGQFRAVSEWDSSWR